MEKNKSLSAALVALLVIAAYFVYFSGDEEFETEPVTNDGAPWRIGYYEGGPYVNYPEYLRYLTYGLMELGWIEEATLPYFEDENDAEVLWTYLANNLQSDYIVFVEGAFWSAEWDNEL
ncbi:MAG TPA: ABC transporter substrate-binding protein, partial [Candidatus Methanofastidiosa archaeon]|nr:ABC transporter substrate-binding protein [Candidatus Methanofastidiosa archaeon]